MKRVNAAILGTISICLLVGTLVLGLNALFYDIEANTLELSSSKLNIEIENFRVGAEHIQQGTKWHTPDASGYVDAHMVQDGILEIQFTIKNLSNIGVNAEVSLELFFLNESDEDNVLLLYPQTIDNQTIRDNAKDNKDEGALIGYGGDDTHKVTSPNGDHLGFSVINPSIILGPEGEGDDTHPYSYKLYLCGSSITTDQLKQILKENKVRIGIHVSATPSEPEIKWNDEAYVYGEVPTSYLLPPRLILELDGPSEIYVKQNTVIDKPSAHATDENGNPIQVEVIGFEDVDFNTYGEYNVKFRAEHNGLVEEKTLTIHVTDGEAPQIIPNNIIVERFVSPSLALESLVTLKDNVDSNQTLNQHLEITVPNEYNSMKPGVYPVCYDLSDRSGMKADKQCIDLTIFAYKAVSPMFDTGLALTTHGRVYSWGYNGNGEAGRPPQGNLCTPGQIDTLSEYEIVQISGGYYHSMALSSDGTAYVWGYDDYGLQANGVNFKVNLIPTKIEGVGTVKYIDSGSYKTALLLNDNGEVYAWGRNESHAAGIEADAIVYKPTKLKFPDNTKIKLVRQGGSQGYAISEDNELYGWGNNHYGLLLQGAGVASVTTPINITDSLPKLIDVQNIKTIETGLYHTYILMNDGLVYAWGLNANGQLGNGELTYRSAPILIEYFANEGIKIKEIKAGWNYGLAIDEDGKVYAWGENIYGQYGLSDAVTIPKLITQKEVTQVTSIDVNYATSALVKSEGYIYMAGSNNLCDLGIGAITPDKKEWVKTHHP